MNELIKNIIKMKNIDNFTFTELRAAYIALTGDVEDLEVVNQLISDELREYLKLKWLVTSFVETYDIITYKKALSFFLNCDIVTEEKNLKIELTIHRERMWELLGAISQLRELWQKHPEIRDVLDPDLSGAYKRKKALQGKIESINLVLDKIQ